jgi:hypothetical protein
MQSSGKALHQMHVPTVTAGPNVASLHQVQRQDGITASGAEPLHRTHILDTKRPSPSLPTIVMCI